MSYSCKALRVNLAGNIIPAVETVKIGAIAAGEVLIDAHYSSINYKDALAITGASRIMKTYPTTAGIDVAGVISASQHPDFAVGEQVLVTGYGMGERFDGGFAQLVKISGDYVIKLPPNLSMASAMLLGTAGFTAGLAVERMLLNGQSAASPILVTGATGGVGSVAIMLLAKCGFEVHALSRKSAVYNDYLLGLGASAVVDGKNFAYGDKPLEKACYAGAIDSVGGKLLSAITRIVHAHGNIAACGLAGGIELQTTVMPFILRGVNLLGIDSVNVDQACRQRVWQLLADKISAAELQIIQNAEIGLEQIIGKVNEFMDGNMNGRYLVNLKL